MDEGKVRRKRASKRSLRAWAWAGGILAFLAPLGVIRAAPSPASSASAPQVVVVPAGSRVVIQQGGPKGASVRVIQTAAAPAASAVSAPAATAQTRGSAP